MVIGARVPMEVPRERDAGESAFTKFDEGPAETQDDVRASFGGRHIAARRCTRAIAGSGP